MRDVVRQRLEKEIKGAIGRLGEDGTEIVDPDEIVTPVPDERRPSAEAKRQVVERMLG